METRLTFGVTRSSAAPPVNKAERAPLPDVYSDRPFVLVVEDDADFGELLVEHLLSSGRRVLWARHGGEALHAIERADGAIALMLLDLRMPVMDGFEVCRRLEATDVRPTVPIVVMTAEHEIRDVSVSDQVVAVLHKPLELERLDAIVDAHVAG